MKPLKICAEIEGVAETPDLMRIWIAYEIRDPRERRRIETETWVLKKSRYGKARVRWGSVEQDVRQHMRDRIKELRKGLKPHPLMGISEEEEESKE